MTGGVEYIRKPKQVQFIVGYNLGDTVSDAFERIQANKPILCSFDYYRGDQTDYTRQIAMAGEIVNEGTDSTIVCGNYAQEPFVLFTGFYNLPGFENKHCRFMTATQMFVIFYNNDKKYGIRVSTCVEFNALVEALFINHKDLKFTLMYPRLMHGKRNKYAIIQSSLPIGVIYQQQLEIDSDCEYLHIEVDGKLLGGSSNVNFRSL